MEAQLQIASGVTFDSTRGRTLLDALMKEPVVSETLCSEQLNQSDVYIPADGKIPEKDRLSSSEECQLHILNNAVQQPAANSNEGEVKVQTFLFTYRIAFVSVSEDRFSHTICFLYITAYMNT